MNLWRHLSLCLLGMRQPSEENDRYNNSSGVVWAKLLRVFQNHPIYATTPGTMPKCQGLYKNGGLNHAFQNLPYGAIYDYIIKNQLVTDNRLFHVDVLRYMFK